MHPELTHLPFPHISPFPRKPPIKFFKRKKKGEKEEKENLAMEAAVSHAAQPFICTSLHAKVYHKESLLWFESLLSAAPPILGPHWDSWISHC